MSKIMIFIDGTWLYSNTGKLAADYGQPDLQIDYGLLPDAVSKRVEDGLGLSTIDIVRTHLFASSPENYAAEDLDLVRRRNDFFSMLKEEYHYEVEIYPIDFRGRRVRAIDRDPHDNFEPREKCVDIALASSLLYYAAIPNAYDIAIVVIGDRDYIPVLQHVRKLAKRVAIVSVRGSCAAEYADPLDRSRIKDVDIIWLNDMIPEVELKYERRQLTCQSEFHVGDRKVWTTYRPRKGQAFYCDECRQIFAARTFGSHPPYETRSENGRGTACEPVDSVGRSHGSIYELKDDRRYGFIRSESGKEYFFHLTDLADCNWDEIRVGMDITFAVQTEPTLERAGHARDVQVDVTSDASESLT